MKPFRWTIAILLLAVSAWAATNVVVTVTMSDEQFTNLVSIAARQGQTPQQYLAATNAGLATEFNRDNDAIQLRLLLQLWDAATPAKKASAIAALR